MRRLRAGGLRVLELVKAGGWPMIPLLILSALALALIVERAWTLRRKAVIPPGLGKDEMVERLGKAIRTNTDRLIAEGRQLESFASQRSHHLL